MSLKWYQFTNVAADHAELTIRGVIGIPKVWGEYGMDAGGSVTDFDQELKALGNVRNITLRIFSPGGYIYDAMAIHDILKSHPATITAKIDGLAASAASWLMLAADRVEMPANAWLMIHNVQGFEAGDHRHMAKVARDLDRFTNDVAKMYERKIKATKGEANLEALRTMMDDETWMSGEEAHQLGLVDALTDSADFTNHAAALNLAGPQLFNFDRVPAGVKSLLQFDTESGDMAKKTTTPPKKPANLATKANAPRKNQDEDPDKEKVNEEVDPDEEEEEVVPDNSGADSEEDQPENEDDPESDEEEEPSNLAKLITKAVNQAVSPLKKEINQLKRLRSQGIDPNNLEGASGARHPKQPDGKKEMPQNLTPMQRIAWARRNAA